jgi:predicted DCC family thiol-disulfide oxidoreductase YuxK
MNKVQIFYDGQCHLCAKEIEIYEKKDKHDRLEMMDISHPEFDPSILNLDSKSVQKYFHIKTEYEKILTGIEAFQYIWSTLEIWKPLNKISRLPIIKQSMHLGYLLFAEIRPFLPKKEKCHDGKCEFR